MSYLSTTQRTHLSAALRKPIWTLLLRFLYRPWYLLTWLLWLAHTPAQAQLFDPSDPRVIGLKEYLERPCGHTIPGNSSDCVQFAYRPGTFGLKVVEALFSDLVVGRPEFYGSATYRNIVRASLNDTYNAAFAAGEPVNDFNYLESTPFLRSKFLPLAQTRILEPLSVLGTDRLVQIEMDGIEKARMLLVIFSINDLFKINKELALEAFDNYYDSFKTPVVGTAIDSEVTYQWIAAIRNRFNQLNNTCTNPTAYNVTGGGAYCANGEGVSINLSDSDEGISYQLKRNGNPVGTPKTGTGAALTFGPEKFTAGTYTIEASTSETTEPISINNSAARVAADGCTALMNGSVTVTSTDPPTADAGVNKTTCGRTAVALAAVTVVIETLPNNNTPVTGEATIAGGWSGGAGTFSNASSPTSSYTPAQSEVGTTVTLTWTVLATSPCATNATDQMTVTVSTPVTAEAGANKATCGETAVALAATGTGTWSGGAGKFSDDSSPTSTYTPAPSEIGTAVTLTWTVTGTAPCLNATDQMTVTVGTPVTVEAGANKTTCGQTPVALAAVTGVIPDFLPESSRARLGAGGGWSGGLGEFSNASSPTSTYTPAASEVGTTVTLTWTVVGTPPCSNATDQMTVTVTRPNTTASLSVLGNATGCAGSTNTPKVVFTGSGGTAPYTFTYKINGGEAQTITTTSGNSVQLSQSTATAGTFVYSLVSVIDDKGCSQPQSGTVTITIESPSAGGIIVYNNNPFCANAGTATVTRTAPAGGTYSCDTPGLSLNATTGAVNLAASTPGTYLVKYTVVGTCVNMTTTASITITAAPTATIAYANSPYCKGSGTASVTLTGKTGGIFSSTSGLSINANTGAIDLAASTAGSYVVTYKIAAANGCAELNTTANVSITTAPAATIAYSGTPYCSNAGTASVTLTGSQGGTFSSTSGLSINANTGAIDLATSTAGTYVVTYTIAAANGCAEFKTTANVSITAAPTATIAYSNSPYCKGAGAASVTLTGKTGGVFSSTTGLSIDANTGAINLATSTAGTYVVTYTIAATNGCAELKTTANVAITTTPSATIAYANSPYCSNAGTASVTLTGSQGGTFSSTAGLSINANTGAIDLAASTAGTYVVTYTIAAANGCAEFKTTANVTITAAPTATIAYSGTPYCANAGTATVTLTGATGGTFSSTSGLSINANTGAINLAASTAGNYVVTYTLAAANGCGELKTTANVSITTTPSATIAYANTPYCSNAGTASVTLTGSQGGTFSSTTGLSINVATGAIDLAASTAGTYVVTYTIPAANGCVEFKTTGNVSVTAAPTATIAYSNTPYCANAGTATVTLTGATGGTFSSTSGLSINANTGVINLAASTAGNYVVTYTLAAANGCAELRTTANVSITTTPAATIAYANTPYCSNAGTASVTLTGSQGGTFSSTTGLSINVVTGAIDLAASTAGSYVVTYTIAAANGCVEFKTMANVSITAAPTATIAYSNTPYCANAGTATVTLTGATGGTFSSTSGLSINANTGVINLAASTAGNYVVTYTLAAANGCGELKTTANVSITTTPSATIAYANTPYCSNAGTASVTLTGSQGGTFSSTAGLSINANTGAIDLAASTAGTYLVTYTISAANGCAEFKTTANVAITAASTATIAYSNSTYCASGTASVNLTGATGGIFSSTSGLSINASTGAIDLGASTAGTYVVTYTIAAANGCGELKATTNVTIQSVLAAPVISSNQSSSVCMGTEVLLYTNCPQGSTVLWSNNSTATILALNANFPSEQTITVKCLGAGVCESPMSAAYTVKWSSTFSLTLINVGQSKSGIKEEGSPKSAWSSQFITPDAGPTIETSTEANPTIYFSENMNKTAPRYWTIHVETCNLGTGGSLTFNMLSKDEAGVERSYNTHENNAPYLMYANRNGFTELYAQNHPSYGFFQDNGSGGNVYDAGLPKGVYKLGIRYWDLKGWGSNFPATRKPQGNELAYQEFWFKIQSKDGIGVGAARVASDNGQRITDNGLFVEVMPNPVSNVLRLKVTEAKNQKVNVSLIDASGRTLLQRGFVPETNTHQEEFNVSELANGMYFLKVNAGDKQAALKVVKVQ